MAKKKSKSFPWWRAPLGLSIAVGTVTFLYWMLGQPGWAGFGPGMIVLCLFPLSLSIRLIVKTSRLSIIKSALICGLGWIVVNVWSQMSASLLCCNLWLPDECARQRAFGGHASTDGHD